MTLKGNLTNKRLRREEKSFFIKLFYLLTFHKISKQGLMQVLPKLYYKTEAERIVPVQFMNDFIDRPS